MNFFRFSRVKGNEEIWNKLNQLMVSAKENNINFCFNHLLKNRHFIKHKDYEYEDEYRYFFEYDKPAGWYINKDNNVITPYVEENLFEYDDNSFPFTLESIILGPAMVEQKLNYHQIINMLKINSNFYTTVEISEIKSYR